MLEALAERDQARSERDTARRALKATRRALEAAGSELDAARESLTAARVESHATQRELERVLGDAQAARNENDTRLEQRLNELLTETGAIHALERSTALRLRSLHRELITDIQALHQLLSRYSPEARLPQVAGWSLSPVGILALTDAIETRGARTVVECGSGTSTLWMGYALKRLGRGKLIALEHLPEYAEKTRAIVAAHGLNDYVEVRNAPLVPLETSRGEFAWYSVDPELFTEPIDVLLVDGPPGTTGRHARYPAVSVFADRLAPGAIIVADDVDRRDEREMLEYWLEEEPRLRRVESPGPGVEMLELAQ